jgi:transcriptional regulator with XRE-family HTH domain
MLYASGKKGAYMQFSAMSDKAALEELGGRIRQQRLSLNISQQDLAQKAGVARIVVQKLENGRICTTKGLIRIMRILGLIERLNLVFPQEGPSPMDLVRMKGHERERASGKRLKKPDRDKK